jgi:hypothetical protein
MFNVQLGQIPCLEDVGLLLQPCGVVMVIQVCIHSNGLMSVELFAQGIVDATLPSNARIDGAPAKR